jgi:hypothetical protein
VADNFGPGGVYAKIPRIDSHGRQQLPMFLRWNPDPVGNDAKNLSGLSPDLQKVIAQARADNPNLNFVIGNGKRSAADQDQAKAWDWSRVGAQDGGDANVHMQGNAVDLWGLDSNGRVQFDPGQQKQISQAMLAASQKLGIGVNWGGNFKTFKDAPHFELGGGGSAASSGAPEGPTAASGAPAPTTTSSSSAAPPGTTLNSNNVIDTLSRNIAQIESGGWKNPYEALGPVVKGGRGQAIGKYQVMPENVPGWTQAALGHSLTPDQFKASPAAQEAVFRDQMQRSLQLYGPKDAASIWFTGKPYNVAGGAANDRYTSNANYVARATAGLDGSTFKPGPAVAAASGAPTAAAASGAPTTAPGATPATPAAPATPTAGTTLPGFQPGSPANKMAQDALKSLGGGGQTNEPEPMRLQQAQPAQAMGGPMMMQPGGQNILGRALAAQDLAQRGFSMQPQPASYYGALAATKPVVPAMMPGQATGVPGMPGTTLNSPSQLQMALMSGQMSPYDMYANAGYGGGFGST